MCSENKLLLFHKSVSDVDAIIRSDGGMISQPGSAYKYVSSKWSSSRKCKSTVCCIVISANRGQWSREHWQFIYSLSVESIWTVLNDSKQPGLRARCSAVEKKRRQDYQVSTWGNETAESKWGFWGGCRRGDSNPHALSSTTPWTLRVYRFHHFGSRLMILYLLWCVNIRISYLTSLVMQYCREISDIITLTSWISLSPGLFMLQTLKMKVRIVAGVRA